MKHGRRPIDISLAQQNSIYWQMLLLKLKGTQFNKETELILSKMIKTNLILLAMGEVLILCDWTLQRGLSYLGLFYSYGDSLSLTVIITPSG